MENIKLVQENAEELLKQMMIQATVKVSEKEEVFNVQIETEETGILIGFHGETLISFQLILSLIVYKKLGSWLKTIVNVGDWRERRDEVLKQMALATAERVVSSGEAIALPGLSSFERRSVHLILADHPQVETVSEGEGIERKLIIKLKEQK